MPRLEVEGVDAFHVEDRKRVVLAIEEDAGRTSSTVSVQNKTGTWRSGEVCFRALLTSDGSELELTRV
jgi:hypothetical protein